MAKALSFARETLPALPLAEMTRVALVAGCGLALVLAGPALPF